MTRLHYFEPSLDERQRLILQALVEEHVSTTRPVASSAVARRSKLGLSAATIRNEFSILEELALIEQPHTSAGRVPSDRGYRVYIDELLTPRPPRKRIRDKLQSELLTSDAALRDILSRACRMLSELTGYTALVMLPTLTRDTMRHLQLGTVDADSVLVLLVTISGRTEHGLFRLQKHRLTPARLNSLNRYLNDMLRGRSLAEIRALDADALFTEGEKIDPDVRRLFDLVQATIPADDCQEVLVEGVVCLLAQPEFQNAEVARPVLEAVEQPEVAAQLMFEVMDANGPQAVIGTEHDLESVQQCSFLGSRYEVAGSECGGLGVLGPRRMRYAETWPVVEAMAQELQNALARL